MATNRKMSQVQGMTYAQASAIARRTPFGTQLPDDVAVVLLGKAQRQAARYDMSLGEKAVRQHQLQVQTGVRK